MYAHVFKGARTGQPGAGGVRFPKTSMGKPISQSGGSESSGGSGGSGGGSAIPASSVDVGGENLYSFANGRPPSGRGSWMFSPKRHIDFMKDDAGKDYYQSPGNTKYSDAKQQAKEWAASKGFRSINVQT